MFIIKKKNVVLHFIKLEFREVCDMVHDTNWPARILSCYVKQCGKLYNSKDIALLEKKYRSFANQVPTFPIKKKLTIVALGYKNIYKETESLLSTNDYMDLNVN